MMTKSITIPSLFCALVIGGQLANPAEAGEKHQQPVDSAVPTMANQPWAGESLPRLVEKEALHDGAVVRLTYDNGVVVVATAGSRVEFTRHVTTDKDGNVVVTGELGIIPPPVSSAEEMKARAVAYRAARRSPFADALAAGYSYEAAARLPGGPNTAASHAAESSTPIVATPGDIYDSACISDTAGNRIRWDGCYRRYLTSDADPNAWYTAEESIANGEGSFWNKLLMGRTDHRYGAGKQVVTYEPTGDAPGTNCQQREITATAYHVSLSESYESCFGRYDIAYATNRIYHQWLDGASDGETVSVAALSWARVPNGQTAGFAYYIAWRYGGF